MDRWGGGMSGGSETYSYGGTSVAGSESGRTAGSVSGAGGSSKREKVIMEIVETENKFLADMHTLKEVYVIPAAESQVFSAADQKILFSTVDRIIETSTRMSELLNTSIEEGGEFPPIAKIFLDMAPEIEATYCEYCKHNEAAINKLTEYASPDCPPDIKKFLQEAQVRLQGRTSAWDLSSLVIKPVQRVLKYPLLIRTLLKETVAEFGGEKEVMKNANDEQQAIVGDLMEASTVLNKVAEKINEVKKRKDAVEKYVEGKGKVNVIHGLSKKITRGVQELKQATGAGESTVDHEYDNIVNKFFMQHEQVQEFSKELANWVKSVKDFLELQETLANTLEEVYHMAPSGDPSSSPKPFAETRSEFMFTVIEYRKVCAKLAAEPWKTAESSIKAKIHPHIQTLLNMFKEPMLVIKKRDKKLLDYNRAKALRSRGEQVDKPLEESAGAYEALNAQLVEELPKMMKLVKDYMDILVAHTAEIQAALHAEVAEKLSGVLQQMVSQSAVRTDVGIVEAWKEAMFGGEDGNGEGRVRDADGRGLGWKVNELVVLERWKMEVFWPWADTAVGASSNPLTYGSEAKMRSKGWGGGSSTSSRSELSIEDDYGSASRNKSKNNNNYNLQDGSAAGSPWSPSPGQGASEYGYDPSVGRPVSMRVETLYSFRGEVVGELDLPYVGTCIDVDWIGGRWGEEGNEDWWHGRIIQVGIEDDGGGGGGSQVGDVGWFPANYVSEV
ncbi:hypothetical protein HDV05_003928 [Chytridiales sp. JEL 0842]|nr:hypothetical protein HDV05_003928 [Chytridiales sp. JEL 0842]